MRLIISLPIILVTVVYLFFLSQNNKFFLNFCDVGQGDGALIVKGSWQMLIDAGPGRKILDCLDNYMPVFDKNLELVVLTHLQQDHIEGFLSVFDYFQVKEVWVSSAVSKSTGYKALMNKIHASGVITTEVYAGDKFTVSGIELEVLWPDRGFYLDNTSEFWTESVGWQNQSDVDPNYIGTVLEIRHGQFEALMTADVDKEVQPLMMDMGTVTSTKVLKVPHHGSKNGMLPEWLEVVSPEIAVISSGKGNTYGHPAKETLKSLNDKGIKTLRTDIDGDIVVVSDGKRWWVRK